jgi:gamma-glutamylcyclotransferase (GGCT)/AIG2-like uncharacterized protein YtfP
VTAGSSPRYLFVYGTLMPGRLRWRCLEPYSLQHRPAAAAGALFDSGRGWPVAVFAGAARSTTIPGAGVVPGVLVELIPARAGECLDVIDAVEETETDELRRVEVVTLAGERAEAYHFTRDVRGLARIERWDAVDPACER